VTAQVAASKEGLSSMSESRSDYISWELTYYTLEQQATDDGSIRPKHVVRKKGD
jgi:hypothetical protein